MGLFEEDSEEYKLLMNRVKMGCAAQSRQIDKTKIGESVKGIPKVWTQFQKIEEDDSEEVKKQKQFYNSLLTDRKPYFFKYKYPALNKELNEYVKKNEENCLIHFSIPLKKLLEIDENLLTNEQKQFIFFYRKFLPVVDSDCVMNNICKYIESIDFKIKQKVKQTQDFDYRILLSNNFTVNKVLYNRISEEIADTFKEWEDKIKHKKEKSPQKFKKENKIDKELEYSLLKDKLLQICSNEQQLCNHLIYLFYVDRPSYNKTILWSLVGKQIYENVKSNTNSFYFPVKNVNGSLQFLYDNYSIERIVFDKGET